MSTVSKENYLKTIYNIGLSDNNAVSTSKVAERLDISNAATCDMAKKLSEKGLISYVKYRGVELTGEGEKIALEVIRRHRLWELFLIEVLGLSWSEVHDEAERLEHHSSDFLVNKIDEFLDYPKFDPHGDPIPQRNGLMPELPEFISLDTAEVGKSYSIVRVDDHSNELMKYFTSIRLSLNTTLLVFDRFDFDGSIIVRINDEQHTLSEKISRRIFVTQLD